MLPQSEAREMPDYKVLRTDGTPQCVSKHVQMVCVLEEVEVRIHGKTLTSLLCHAIIPQSVVPRPQFISFLSLVLFNQSNTFLKNTGPLKQAWQQMQCILLTFF